MTPAAQIKERLDAKTEEAKSAYAEFAAAREKAVKDGTNLAEDTEKFDELNGLNAKWSGLSDEVAELQRKLVDALGWDGREAPKDDDPERKDEPGKRQGTAGDRIVNNEMYKAWVEENRVKLTSGAKQRNVEMPPIEAMGRDEFKALITGLSDTSGGAFIEPDRQQYVPLALRPLTIRNLVTIGETDSDLVEWVKENSFTNAAAETAEATATAGASGTKPESALDYLVVQSTVKTIAHWIPATKRALADVGQLRTLIDARLEDGVELRLDSQMVNGDATGENLRGILSTSGVLTQAKGADPAVEAILKAITQIRLQFLEPTAILMHPTDAQNARLAKNANGDYYFGPPNIAGALQVWGLPIVQSPVVAAGTAVVAKWNEAILWVREGVSVSATDSHADFFIRNMVAVLAEGRFAFAIPRPFAFCTVTGL